MRVLIQGRPDLAAVRGGDTVHVACLLSALREAGVDAVLSTELRPDLGGFDLVHVFNLMRVDEACLQVDNARFQGKPVVITPLYWNIGEAAAAGGPVPEPWLRRWPGEQRLRRQALEEAAAVLTGAAAEAAWLERDFGIGGRCVTVPLGVPPLAVPPGGGREPAAPRPAPFAPPVPRGCVLCVARISPEKNQLGLIRALEGTDIPLAFIGQAHDAAYLQACRERAGGRAVFLGDVGAAELAGAYAAAKVHALASWCELPGLATLEAALAGCNVVTTERGTARDYLGPDAWYCDPARPESVREAVLAAYAAPRDGAAAARAARFTWERAAHLTAEVYRRVLERGSARV